MQQILAAVGQMFRKSILILGLVSLLSLSSLYIFADQPSYAGATQLRDTSQTSVGSQTPENREQAYEEAVETLNNPKGLEQEYEKNLESYKESQPNQGLVEQAKEVVEKVTGQE